MEGAGVGLRRHAPPLGISRDTAVVHLTEEFRSYVAEKAPWCQLKYVPANCTDVAQPMDVAVQKVLKDRFRSAFTAYRRDTRKWAKWLTAREPQRWTPWSRCASVRLRWSFHLHVAVLAVAAATLLLIKLLFMDEAGAAGAKAGMAGARFSGDEERFAAELDCAIAEDVLEEVLPSDGAESKGHERGSSCTDDDDAPADDGGDDDDDGADVGQLTAIAQRLARDQRAQRGRVQATSALGRPQSV
eukprot:350136-Chlamydomonas_euryale.AAC.16